MASVSSWLETAETSASAAERSSIIEFRRRCRRHRVAVAERRAWLCDAMVGRGPVSKQGVDALDLQLLDELSWVARRTGTCLAIHGGASIRRADLRQLHRHGVARVNFSAQPFLRFLRAVAAVQANDTISDPKSPNDNPQSPNEVQRFLDPGAENWMDWLERLPPRLEPLVSGFERDYFETLQGSG